AVAAPVSIVGGKIFINSAIIKDGSITSAKIEDSLQSENYESGTRGWRIDKSGSFELNGEETGLRRVLRPNYDRYYDTQSGILVIEIGELA
ncbi:phage tail tip fiber protein, partial [Acinetobacter baumannii]